MAAMAARLLGVLAALALASRPAAAAATRRPGPRGRVRSPGGWLARPPSATRAESGMNLFADIWGGGELEKQQPPRAPLLPGLVKGEAAHYVLQEKLLSLSGEDFRVRDASGREVITISGANLNIGGAVLDKLYFKPTDSAAGEEFSVERRIVAASTCYDLYRDGRCIARIERELFSLSPCYKFVYEQGERPSCTLKASGSFSQRKYTFTREDGGQVVARVGRNLIEFFNDVDQYQVEVAAGVDAAAVLAVAVVIDEDHDENDD